MSGFTQENRKIVKYIDLFCGLGAFHQAFDKLSTLSSDITYTCVAACDYDEGIQKIYEENYNMKPQGDINTIDLKKLPDFDILCAGFPCQPFSVAGKKEGFQNQSKGNLFYKLLECIDVKNPSTIFLENVKNLETIHGGVTFQKIKHELQKRNYSVSYKVLNSKFFGCPQSRSRIYIVCHKKKEFQFPIVTYDIVPVSSILDTSVTDFLDFEEKYNIEECEDNGGMMTHKLFNKISGKGGRQGERVYSIDTCGPTICASSGGPGAKTGLYQINGKFRTLTVKETLKMFGFPDDFQYKSLENNKKLLFYLGNSIVVNVLEEICKELEKQLFKCA